MRIKAILRATVLIAFFVSTIYLVAGLPVIFNSPDEAANFVFSSQMAEEQSLVLIEEANPVVGGILHPRSILVIGERLVPRSFLGLPVLYGLVGALTLPQVMLYLTPVLALLAVLAWRTCIKKVFNDVLLADVAAVLLMIHPAFWYYSGRTMMHNIGFISFLIFAAYFSVLAVKKHEGRWGYFLHGLSGASLALAIAFRASEILWLAPLVLVSLWWSRKQFSWKRLAAMAIGFAIAAAPFAMLNHNLYGSVATTGYQVTESVPSLTAPADELVVASEPEVAHASIIDEAMSVLFPFGIAEKAVARHAWQYGIALYPWMTAVFAIGFAMVVLNRKKLDHQDAWESVASLLVALTLWLGVVYGSWVFHDNPDPNIYSLGNSYVRYWLPIFLFSTPFGAFAIVKGVETFKSTKIRSVVAAFILIILTALSFQLVFFGDDGFVPTRKALLTFDQKRSRIVELTEDDAIVIVDRADKFVYPSRRVVSPLRSEVTYAAMPALLSEAQLYYFGITLPPEDLDYLNEVKLAGDELMIEPVETILDETLYRIYQP